MKKPVVIAAAILLALLAAAMKCTAYARHSLSTVDSVMFMNALKYILLLKTVPLTGGQQVY